MSERHEFNYHNYYDHPMSLDHEAHIEVPALQADDRPITIHVSKVGGGTVGESYAGNWAYKVNLTPGISHHGDDLYTGTPHTHEQAARVLASILSASLPEGPLADRLSLFAEDGE